jgi:hypothetical protein
MSSKASHSGLDAQAEAAWRESVQRLGLDPERVRRRSAHFYQVIVRGLAANERLHQAPVLQDQVPSPLEHGNLDAASPERLIQALRLHLMGMSVIRDPEVLRRVEEYADITYNVYAAPDVDVTKDKPLLIDSGHAITTYGEVRLHPGGYIRVTVPCHFRCQVLRKVGGAAAGASEEMTAADIRVLGQDGTDVKEDESYWTRKNGKNGNTGQPGPDAVSCTPGGNGQPGGNGADGQPGDRGSNGGAAPEVAFTIRELQSSVSVLTCGGRGGNAGSGGRGGAGGSGGKGGAGRWCGAEWVRAGNGGQGGDGGNGANGGVGGDGGKGGTVVLRVEKLAPGVEILRLTPPSPAGRGADGGIPGIAGQGGEAGGPGGGPGQNGRPGPKTGTRGGDGTTGAVGEIKVNPPTA